MPRRTAVVRVTGLKKYGDQILHHTSIIMPIGAWSHQSDQSNLWREVLEMSVGSDLLAHMLCLFDCRDEAFKVSDQVFDPH